MPKITEEVLYNGAEERMRRLGLTGLLDEVKQIITGFHLAVFEQRDANGGAAVRRMMDEQFEHARGWQKKASGGIDWRKSQRINGAEVCVGVEVQFSARSDLLVIDIIHLRKAITQGGIDVGVLVVPNNRLSVFLTDRGPSFADAQRHIKEARADDLPLMLLAIEHDAAGEALPKQAKARKKTKKAKRTR